MNLWNKNTILRSAVVAVVVFLLAGTYSPVLACNWVCVSNGGGGENCGCSDNPHIWQVDGASVTGATINGNDIPSENWGQTYAPYVDPTPFYTDPSPLTPVNSLPPAVGSDGVTWANQDAATRAMFEAAYGAAAESQWNLERGFFLSYGLWGGSTGAEADAFWGWRNSGAGDVLLPDEPVSATLNFGGGSADVPEGFLVTVAKDGIYVPELDRYVSPERLRVLNDQRVSAGLSPLQIQSNGWVCNANCPLPTVSVDQFLAAPSIDVNRNLISECPAGRAGCLTNVAAEENNSAVLVAVEQNGQVVGVVSIDSRVFNDTLLENSENRAEHIARITKNDADYPLDRVLRDIDDYMGAQTEDVLNQAYMSLIAADGCTYSNGRLTCSAGGPNAGADAGLNEYVGRPTYGCVDGITGNVGEGSSEGECADGSIWALTSDYTRTYRAGSLSLNYTLASVTDPDLLNNPLYWCKPEAGDIGIVCQGNVAFGGASYIVGCNCPGGGNWMGVANDVTGNQADAFCSNVACKAVGQQITWKNQTYTKECDPGRVYSCSGVEGSICGSDGTMASSPVNAHACGYTGCGAGQTACLDRLNGGGGTSFVGCSGLANCYARDGGVSCQYEPGLSCGAFAGSTQVAQTVAQTVTPTGTGGGGGGDTPPYIPPDTPVAVCGQACGAAAGGATCIDAGTACMNGTCQNASCSESEQNEQCECNIVNGPVCIDIYASKTNPVLGDVLTFTCAEVENANRYEFRTAYFVSKTAANGAVITDLAPSTATSNVSMPFTVDKIGRYVAQCRPCVGNDLCSEWEPLDGQIGAPTLPPTPGPSASPTSTISASPQPSPSPVASPVVTPQPTPTSLTGLTKFDYVGDGRDGNLDVSGTFDPTTTSSNPNSRRFADAISYKVKPIAAGSDLVERLNTSQVLSDGFAEGDEIMLICLEKPELGYDLKSVKIASSGAITLKSSMGRDLSSCPEVTMQRVPQYQNVTLNGNDVLTGDGGSTKILALRVSGNLSLTDEAMIYAWQGVPNSTVGGYGTYPLNNNNLLLALARGKNGGGTVLSVGSNCGGANGIGSGNGSIVGAASSGGIIFIAAQSMNIGSTISAAGGNGSPAASSTGCSSVCCNFYNNYASPGGAGGSILLISQTAVNVGEGKIDAKGGLHGYSNAEQYRTHNGRINVIAPSVTGTTTPSFSSPQIPGLN